FAAWMNSHECVNGLARWTRYAIEVCRKFYGGADEIDEVARTVRRVTAESNHFFLAANREIVRLFAKWAGAPAFGQTAALQRFVLSGRRRYEDELIQAMHRLERVANDSAAAQELEIHQVA
ncbi:MAG TPA: hypothetical protein VLW65_17225, partial [Bryobacteraceae bacterium]|nr:hypothetical protein [Bryobacteraceae bacterium]